MSRQNPRPVKRPSTGSRKARQKVDPVKEIARRLLLDWSDPEAIIAGPEVRAAARRFFADLKHAKAKGIYWDLEAAERFFDYCRDLLTVQVGGQDVPYELIWWQVFAGGNLFGWKWRKTGRRRFRTSYIEAAKGAGKSPFAAAIGLYMMTACGELEAQIVSAAAKREQAAVIFDAAVGMVERSPELNGRIIPSGKTTVWQLTHRTSRSRFRPLASDKTQSGPLIYCGLIDELHEHKDRYTIDMVEAGFKGKLDPLLFVITNSGFDRTTVCWEWHEDGVAIVHGMREKESHFVLIFSLDEEDDPLEDETVWIKTNPGIGATITEEYLRERVADARAIPGREGGVRRLNFCEWTEAEESWMTRGAWKACEPEEPLFKFDAGACQIPDEWRGAMAFLGLDLAFSFDLAALSVVLPEDDKLVAWVEYFTPLDTLLAREKRDKIQYTKWRNMGLLHAIPGNDIRLEHIGRRLGEIANVLDIQWAAFDKYRHKALEAQMRETGIVLPWIEHPQGFRRAGDLEILGPDGKKLENPLWMPDSVKETEAAILDRRLVIQPSPITRWNVSNVKVRADPSGVGQHILDKRKSTGRIDGVTALVMGVGAAMMRLEPKQDITPFLRAPVMAG